MDKEIFRKEIWTLDLGEGEGSEQRGFKYCLVVQNDKGNHFSPTTIVLPITSKVKGFNLTHVELVDVLRETSYILCEQIRTVSKLRFQNKIATVDEEVMEDVGRKIRFQLEI